MQIFFNTSASTAHSILRYADWNYVRSGLQRNLAAVKHYYNSRVIPVKGNHLLARIINTADISHNLEIERYYDILDAKANNVSNALQLTSPINKGRLFDGVFYGQGTTEVVMVNQDSFDPVEAYKNWRTITPVTVVQHPRSDLNLLLPNGKKTSAESGIAIISVNIPMLLIQWRGFAADQMYMNDNDSTGLQTVAHFIHRFVLPGMLDTQLDLAVFNRLSNLVNGAPMGDSNRLHPFNLVDYSSKVDAILDRIVKDMQGRHMEYSGILETIPAVVSDNMRQALRIPDFVSTRQIAWVDLIARIDAITTVVKLGGEESIKLNYELLNNLAIEYRLAQNSRILSSALPSDIVFDAYSKMSKLSKLVGKTLNYY